MLGLILWTLVFVWAFLVGGAAYLAWSYFTTTAQEQRSAISGSETGQRRQVRAPVAGG